MKFPRLCTLSIMAIRNETKDELIHSISGANTTIVVGEPPTIPLIVLKISEHAISPLWLLLRMI
jgi:hypothetical protein